MIEIHCRVGPWLARCIALWSWVYLSTLPNYTTQGRLQIPTSNCKVGTGEPSMIMDELLRARETMHVWEQITKLLC